MLPSLYKMMIEIGNISRRLQGENSNLTPIEAFKLAKAEFEKRENKYPGKDEKACQ